MEFEALYFGDRIRTINSEGDVGVVTLWSKVDSVIQILGEVGIDLGPNTSRISVVTNLYGNGLPQMLRNLLWNPQIRHIVVVGKNLSGSREWLIHFFQSGLEEVQFLGAKSFRICNTNRNIDGELKPEMFNSKPIITVFGDIGDSKTKEGLAWYFNALPGQDFGQLARVSPPEIPEPSVTRFPSEVLSHTIVRRTPMEAWSELIFRIHRFGHRNIVAKSTGEETRIELLNTHVVIQEPMEESAECLDAHGFSLSHFKDYQHRFLESEKPFDLDYTYGNRLRGYFRHDLAVVDSPALVAERLRKSPDSRHCYIALWDNSRDLPEGTGCPCFVSAFFRKFDGRLNLTATFRVHNAMSAWPENVYGLIALQRFVAEKSQMQIGPITVISHSISIDPSLLETAKKVADGKKSDEVIDPATGKLSPRMDPNGTFTVTFDRDTWELVVEHSFSGMKLGEYRGRNSEEVERGLARDVALSEISHALYLGREIARAEIAMKSARAKATTGPAAN